MFTQALSLTVTHHITLDGTTFQKICKVNDRERYFYFCEVSSGVFLSTIIAIKSAGSNFSHIWSPLSSAGNAEHARGCHEQLLEIFCGYTLPFGFILLWTEKDLPVCSGAVLWGTWGGTLAIQHWLSIPEMHPDHTGHGISMEQPRESQLQEVFSPLLLHSSFEYLLETAKERASCLLLLHLEIIPRKCNFSV